MWAVWSCKNVHLLEALKPFIMFNHHPLNTAGSLGPAKQMFSVVCIYVGSVSRGLLLFRTSGIRPWSFQTSVWLWVSYKRWRRCSAHRCFCLLQVTASRANRFQWRTPTGWTRRTGRTASTSTSAIASPSTAPSPISGIPSESRDKTPSFN